MLAPGARGGGGTTLRRLGDVEPVRRAVVEDAEAICRVQRATWEAAYAGLLAPSVIGSLPEWSGPQRWAAHIASSHVYVAVAGGEVAGFSSSGPSRDPDAPDGTGEVYALYVEPAAQRRGLGAALLSAAVGALGAPRVTLWVLSANAAARAFYASQGWRWDGTQRTIDIRGGLVDEVRYERPATLSSVAR